MIRESHTERQTTLLVRANGHVYDSCWELHEVDLEEIVLAYLGHRRPAAFRAPRRREAVGAMIWVGWRQQRTETLIAAGSSRCSPRCSSRRDHMASVYHHDGLAACLGANPSCGCDQAIVRFLLRFTACSSLSRLVHAGSGLVGVLLAAPFVLDLENGTYRLYWTQSITRRRWIVTKLGVGVAAAAPGRGA